MYSLLNFIYCVEFKLLGNDDILFEDFIDHAQAKFLAYYILYVRHETIERELQCMYGVQMMSVVFDYPKGEVLTILQA